MRIFVFDMQPLHISFTSLGGEDDGERGMTGGEVYWNYSHRGVYCNQADAPSLLFLSSTIAVV